jgi:exosome complex component CSL4
MGRVVLPGEELAVSEEYLAGEGTFEDDGHIRAATLGELDLDPRERVARVRAFNPPVEVRVGDLVIAEIRSWRESMASLRVLKVEGRDRTVSGNTDASLHISKISNKYTESIGREYRLGDIIRAKVIQLKPSIQLDTSGKELGALLSRCIQCRRPLEKRGRQLYCEACDRTEYRKTAWDYGNPERT